MIGLPGDYTSPSRFIRAAFLRHAVTPPQTGAEAVQAVAHILNTVDIPVGVAQSRAGDQIVSDYTQWAAIKAQERAARAERGALDGVALGLPALTRAVKLQSRAARVGFDWPSTDEVMDKLAEEMAELRAASDPAHRAEEFGDLLFVMANLARHMGIDPEEALRGANAKFSRRFQSIEAALAARGRRPEQSDLAEMDALWNAAKAAERGA